MVAAAIACHNLEFFQHISTAHTHTTKSFPPIFLQTPSRFSKYLRLVIASWIADNAVNMEHVVPQLWKQCQQHTMFSSSSAPNAHHDHDYCSESTKGSSGKGEESSMVVISDDDDEIRTTTTASPTSDDMEHSCPVPSTKKALNGGPAKVKKYKCTNCDSSFTRKFTLRRHILTKHPKQELNTSDDMEHSCPVPSTKKALNGGPAKVKKYKCTNCDSFTRKFTLRRHILTKHPKQELDGNSVCHDCKFKCHKIGDLHIILSLDQNK